MTPQEFLQDSIKISHFYSDKYEKMCCFSDEIQIIMDNYAKHVLEIAANKATITLEESSDDPYDHYPIVDKNSIINCLIN